MVHAVRGRTPGARGSGFSQSLSYSSTGWRASVPLEHGSEGLSRGAASDRLCLFRSEEQSHARSRMVRC